MVSASRSAADVEIDLGVALEEYREYGDSADTTRSHDADATASFRPILH